MPSIWRSFPVNFLPVSSSDEGDLDESFFYHKSSLSDVVGVLYTKKYHQKNVKNYCQKISKKQSSRTSLTDTQSFLIKFPWIFLHFHRLFITTLLNFNKKLKFSFFFLLLSNPFALLRVGKEIFVSPDEETPAMNNDSDLCCWLQQETCAEIEKEIVTRSSNFVLSNFSERLLELIDVSGVQLERFRLHKFWINFEAGIEFTINFPRFSLSMMTDASPPDEQHEIFSSESPLVPKDLLCALG